MASLTSPLDVLAGAAPRSGRMALAGGLALLVGASVATLLLIFSGLSFTKAAGQAEPGASIYGVSALAQQEIPSLYLTLYERAGQRYGIDWSVLAGIGKV